MHKFPQQVLDSESMAELNRMMKEGEEHEAKLKNTVDALQELAEKYEANLSPMQEPMTGPIVPDHGEQAAKAIEDLAERRAEFIVRFAQDLANRAQRDLDLAKDFAHNIRIEATELAAVIRRKTAVTHNAGLRIVDAYNEFNEEIRKP